MTRVMVITAHNSMHSKGPSCESYHSKVLGEETQQFLHEVLGSRESWYSVELYGCLIRVQAVHKMISLPIQLEKSLGVRQ